ncbi:arf-GAP domain and FG repeat-containing protein 1-like isoform X2 [Xenia sp. Carnegie-2017]|uniref:arf-GAP domain and FG repeat-containing protein 1-like isoform X2 n=1 Tax=Xenia sp. Carnegie-2017 TaxID=2897299 RepID=UPI001F03D587|nr:arf-GAP domain and FG repeat-containing protein 1-like isoform X2 [Xenia sp. Carnegie-2017]
MASTKKNTKKQDEKHLKILRDLCSLPHNKKCFDCGQRGPTYVNMTIGSFVCTSCSGILRGLNPQHRVKSISMTSFTPSEIEFLQNAGNEVCGKSWLGLWNSSNPPEPESKDEIKVKEFLMKKYDRKKWYIPPSQLQAASPKKEALQSSSERKPLKHLLGENAPTLVVGKKVPAPSKTAPTVTLPAPQPVPHRTANATPKAPVNDLLGNLEADAFGQPAASSGFNAFGSQPVAPASSASFDPFASSQPQQVQEQQPVQLQQPQQFGTFDAFGNTAPSSNFDAFVGVSSIQQQQQQPSQPQGFNAFGSQPQQSAQSQPKNTGFDPFGTTQSNSQTSTGFDAFGSTTQQAEQKPNVFAAFGSSAQTASSFDAFGNFTTPSASQPTKTTSTVGNFGPVVSSSATGMSSSAADKYAALSDLDSIFKEQTTTPISGAQQGSLYGNTSNSSTSLGTPGNSTGASVMSAGPNPFASVGSTAPSFSQSNPFQISAGVAVQSNGFSSNSGFSTAPSSVAHSMSFSSAGMTAMAANQFNKMSGDARHPPGAFSYTGGTTGQSGVGQFSGNPQKGNSLSGSHFGASQFGGASQPAGNQFAGVTPAMGGQLGTGQFAATNYQQPQQQGFPYGTNQFGQQHQPNQFGQQHQPNQFGQQHQPNQFGQPHQPNQFGQQHQPNQFGQPHQPNQFGQQHQQNQFGQQHQPNQFGQHQQLNQFDGGWQQKSQSNPFANSAPHGGGYPIQQRQSTNPFM